MVTPLGQLPGKVNDLASFIDRGKADTVSGVGMFAKQQFLAGPPKVGLRQGAKLGGRRWGAGYNLRKGSAPTALVSYRGPVHWVDKGTGDHVIRPRPRRRKKAVAFGGVVRASVRHPGTKARPFWPDVRKRVQSGAPKMLQADLRTNMVRAGFSAARGLK